MKKMPVIIKGAKPEDASVPLTVNYGLSVQDPQPAHIGITGLMISYPRRFAGIRYAIGAYDARDNFVPAPNLPE